MEEELFSTFKLAIEREQEAYELYTYLADKTEDGEAKEVLMKLASDEAEHKSHLLQLYESMRSKEAP